MATELAEQLKTDLQDDLKTTLKADLYREQEANSWMAVQAQAATDPTLLDGIIQSRHNERDLYSRPEYNVEQMTPESIMAEALDYQNITVLRDMYPTLADKRELIRSTRKMREKQQKPDVVLSPLMYNPEQSKNGPSIRAANSMYLADLWGVNPEMAGTLYDNLVTTLFQGKEPEDIRPVSKLIRQWYTDKHMQEQGIDPVVFRAARKYQDGEDIDWSVIVANMTDEQQSEFVHTITALGNPKNRGFFAKTAAILARSTMRSGRNVAYNTIFTDPQSSDLVRQKREQLISEFQSKNKRPPFGIEMYEIDYNATKEAQDEALTLKKMPEAKVAKDPITGDTALEKLYYGSLSIAPDIVFSAAEGAGTGMGPIGTAHYWWQQASSGMYEQMKDLGFDNDTSARTARTTAIPVAIINAIQVKQLANLSPAVRRKAVQAAEMSVARWTAQKALATGKTFAVEWGEEGLEAITEVAGIAMADVLNKENPSINWMDDVIKPELEGLKQAGWALPGVVLGGKAIEISAEAKYINQLTKSGLEKKLARSVAAIHGEGMDALVPNPLLKDLPVEIAKKLEGFRNLPESQQEAILESVQQDVNNLRITNRQKAVDTAVEILTKNGIENVIVDAVETIEGAEPGMERTGETSLTPAGHAVIKMALGSDEVTGGHEVMHVLETLLTQDELTLIDAEYQNDREAAAEAFGEYYAKNRNGGQPKTRLEQIWDKIVQTFVRIRNAFAGRGYRSADDVFRDLTAGRYQFGQAKQVRKAARAAKYQTRPQKGTTAYRTEKAHASYKGKTSWGKGLYLGLDEAAVGEMQLDPNRGTREEWTPEMGGVDRYFIPANVKLKRVDISELYGEDFGKFPKGEKLKEQIISEGYDGVVLITDDANLGGDQIIIYTPEAIQSVMSAKYQTRPALWFSQLQQTIEDKMPAKMDAEQFKNWVAKQPGVKEEELDYSGILDLTGKITKQDVLDTLAANRIEIEEVTKGEPEPLDVEIVRREDGKYDVLVDGMPYEEGFLKREHAEPAAERARLQQFPVTKFSQYQLPGGENYRELLLRMPERKVPRAAEDTTGWTVEVIKDNSEFYGQRDIIVRDAQGDVKTRRYGFRGTDAEAIADSATQTIESRKKEAERQSNFRSSHFDETNILAHVRFNDRTGPNGEKILHVEEIQSDWHQKGRDQGYQVVKKPKLPDGWKVVKLTPEEAADMGEEEGTWMLVDETNADVVTVGKWETEEQAIESAIAQAEDVQQMDIGFEKGKGVPDAPFKKTWPDLAFKRMLRYAIDNGYDMITWTTGEQQAERYDLSKQLTEIRWNKIGIKTENPQYQIGFTTISGDRHTIQKPMEASELADHVGKEIAEKIVTSEKTKGEFTGLDLKVGGEGMKGFYDQIIPSIAKKLTKKFGGEVKDVKIDTTHLFDVDEVTVHSLAITDAMKEKLAGPMPMFQTRPDTSSPAFKKWFKKSKVVNEDGSPRVVYHGTLADFDEFKLSDASHKVPAVYFAGTPQAAESYAALEYNEYDPDVFPAKIIPAYLSLQNPLVIDESEERISFKRFLEIIKQAKEDGHDGMIIYNALDDHGARFTEKGVNFKDLDGAEALPTDLYVVFDPTQIKSTFNQGRWSRKTNDIRYQEKQSMVTEKEVLRKIADMATEYQGNTMSILSGIPIKAREEEAIYDYGDKGLKFANAIFDPKENRMTRTFKPEWLKDMGEIPIGTRVLLREVKARTPEVWPVMKKAPHMRYWKLDHYIAPKKIIDKVKAILPEDSLKPLRISKYSDQEAGAVFDETGVPDFLSMAEGPKRETAPLDEPMLDFDEAVDQIVASLEKRITKAADLDRSQLIVKYDNILAKLKAEQAALLERQETAAAKALAKQAARLEDRIERYKRKYRMAKDKLPPLKRDSVKATIRKATGQVKVGDVIDEYKALREGMHKAEQAARKAFSEGKKEGIETAKAYYQEMLQRRAEVRKLRKRINAALRIINKTKQAIKGKNSSIAFTYKEAIDNLTEGLTAKTRSKKTMEQRERMRQFLDRHPEEIHNLPVDLPIKFMAELNNKVANDYTVEELERIASEVKRLANDGRLLKKFRDAQQKDAELSLANRLMNIVLKGKELKKVEGANVGPEKKTAGQIAKGILKAERSYTMSPDRILDMLDGGKGTFDGLWLKTFWDDVNDKESEKLRHTHPRLDGLAEKMEELDISPLDLVRPIQIPNVPAGKGEWTYQRAMGVYAAVQNEKAKLAVTFGNGVETDESQRAVIDALPDKYKQLTDWMIDNNETRFPDYRKTVIEITNNDLDHEERYTTIRRVEGDFQTPDRQVNEEVMMRQFLKKGRTNKGSTISRQNIPKEYQKPIDLDVVKVFTQQVDVHEHYIAYTALTNKLHRILANEDLKAAIVQEHGKDIYDALVEHVDLVANPNIYKTYRGLDSLSSRLRRNMVTAVLIFNVLTYLKQLPAVALYMGDAGPEWLLQSALEFSQNPNKLIEFCRGKDPLLTDVQLARELEEMKSYGNEYVTRLNQVRNIGMKPISFFDSIGRTIGWYAVYQKAIAAGKGEAEAIRLARNATLRTQNTAAAKDIPRMYAQNEGMNWVLMFTHQLNQIYLMMTYDIPAKVKSGDISSAAASFVGLSIAALGEWMIQNKTIPDDPEDILDVGLSQFLASIPIIGSTTVAYREGYFGRTNPIIGKPAQALAYITQGKLGKAVKPAIEAASYYTGLPYVAGNRIYKTFEEGEPMYLIGGPSKDK